MGITKGLSKILKSVQEIFNLSFDTDYNVVAMQPLGHDGVSLQRINADNMAVKITVSGSYTYIALAATGTAQATAKWQVKRIYDDGAGTTTITWADGDSEFDNVATDLTALSYS